MEHARRSVEVMESELTGGGIEGVKLIREKKDLKGKGRDMDLERDEDENENEGEFEEERVPYLLIPLVGNRAISVHVDQRSGRSELRVATTSSSSEIVEEASEEKIGQGGGEGGEGTSQESRLRSASDRINSLRFGTASRGGNGEGDYWMKSLPEVIAKIKATVSRLLFSLHYRRLLADDVAIWARRPYSMRSLPS